MTFGAALSLSLSLSLLFLLPPSLAWAPSSCLQGWRMTLNPGLWCTSLSPPVGGNLFFSPFFFFLKRPVCRLLSGHLVDCSLSGLFVYLFSFLPVDGHDRLASSLSP